METLVREGGSVDLGGGVVIRVLSVSGSRVSLGVEAPSDVAIWRGEIAEAATAQGERKEAK